MAEWCLPEAYKHAGVGLAGNGPVHLWSTPIPPFFATRPLSGRLGARIDSRACSRSRRTRQLGSTPMEAEEAESSTPQSSVVSSVVVVDNKKAERPAETSKARYQERVKELDVENLACSLWLRSMDLIITSSPVRRGDRATKVRMYLRRKAVGLDGVPLNARERQVAVSNPKARERQGQDAGECSTSHQTKLEFLEGQLEVVENIEMTVGRFVTAANEVTIGGFWREHAKGELKN